MKNVAIIIYSLKGGGAERVASLLSNELSKRYNVFLILFDSNNMIYLYGGKLIDINVKSHDSILMKVINVIRRCFKLRKIKKEYKINHSISLLESANIVNVLSSVNDKITVSIHSDIDTRKQGILACLNRYIYSKTDNIVGVSKGIKTNLIKNYKTDRKKTRYIYNPIDIENIQKLAREGLKDNGFDSNDFTIINMGRLTDAKGQWHLIRSLSYVKKEIKNIKLIILGEGELRTFLEELVSKLDLNDNVIFMGHKKNPFKYMRKSNLFVFTSLYEGFGNVIIEAMACDLPIISTDCRSGPREILAPETDWQYKTEGIEYAKYGVLVPVCDGIYYDYDNTLTREEKLLAESIIELYQDKKLRNKYRDRGRERIRNFGIETIGKEWETIIN